MWSSVVTIGASNKERMQWRTIQSELENENPTKIETPLCFRSSPLSTPNPPRTLLISQSLPYLFKCSTHYAISLYEIFTKQRKETTSSNNGFKRGKTLSLQQKDIWFFIIINSLCFIQFKILLLRQWFHRHGGNHDLHRYNWLSDKERT